MAISAFNAAHRFGMGSGPGEIARIGNDPAGWLWRQTDSRLPVSDPNVLQQAFQTVATATRIKDKRQREAATRTIFKQVRQSYREDFGGYLTLAAQSSTPFMERLVWFWSNHFTVSAKGKPRVAPFAASYQDDAIRPYVFGRFEDMVIAAEQHPAMQIYLDNTLSVGPNSPAGRRRKRGLNENLGREILELHTMGVGSGYSQRDVTELARLITGWAIPLGRQAQASDTPFAFMPARHEPGTKTILGQPYRTGLQEGERALRDLAHRPETAKFLATKLCRHFIADNPPRLAVDHVAQRFLKTGGDLRQTTQALIEAIASPSVQLGPKYRQPIDHMAATIRALGPLQVQPKTLLQALVRFGQAPLFADSPAGFPDQTSDWAAPDAIMRRLEWSGIIARRQRNIPNPGELAHSVLDDNLSRSTQDAIAGAESGDQAITLLLVSPEFMWK